MPDHINQQIGSGNDINQKRGHDDWFFASYRGGMETLGSRLRHARDAAGLTQAELAERVGMAGQQSIEAIEVGRSKNPTRIYEIAKACGVTVEWLQGREEGAPLKTKKTTKIEGSDPAKEMRSIVQKLSEVDHSFSSPLFENALPEIDLRGGASYGGGKTDEDWSDGDISGDKPVAHWGLPDSYVRRELGLQYGMAEVLQVRGDSMDDGTAKGLSSGDRVIIDRTDTDARQGGIFAVFDGEGVIIKQVEIVRGHHPTRIICKSRNPTYDPIPLVLDGSVRIIGRVAGVISRR